MVGETKEDVIIIQRVFLFVWCALGLSWAQSGRSATVRLRVVDVFGHELPYRVKSFVNIKTKEDLASRFVALEANGIRLGSYRYHLLRSDRRGEGDWLAGSIEVDRKEMLTVLVTGEVAAFIGDQPAAISFSPPKDFSMEGIISPTPESTEQMFIRLKGVYQNYQLDLTVGPDGIFRIPEPLEGLYVLIVVNRGNVVGVQPTMFKQGRASTRFIVNLKEIGVSIKIVDQPLAGEK